MPVNGYFDTPFATSGDKVAVPDPVQGGGTVSYDQGYPIGYSTPVTAGGKLITRTSMNQLFYDITLAIQNWQQNTIAPFITTTMNGGTPYTYPKYAMVFYGGVAYVSNTNGNADTPPSSKWNVFPIAVANNLYTGGTTTGSANAQVIAALNPATGFSLSNPGETIICTAGFTNTGDTTISITSPAISGIYLRKNSSSGLVALTGGEIAAGNVMTLTVDASSTYLVLDAGLPASLFLQKANNLSDVASTSTSLSNLSGLAKASNLSDVASAATSRTNLSAAKSGANTDITSLQGSALIATPLGVGAYVMGEPQGSAPSAGGTISGSSLNPVNLTAFTVTDTVTGTWAAMQSSNTVEATLWQRIA